MSEATGEQGAASLRCHRHLRRLAIDRDRGHGGDGGVSVLRPQPRRGRSSARGRIRHLRRAGAVGLRRRGHRDVCASGRGHVRGRSPAPPSMVGGGVGGRRSGVDSGLAGARVRAAAAGRRRLPRDRWRAGPSPSRRPGIGRGPRPGVAVGVQRRHGAAGWRCGAGCLGYGGLSGDRFPFHSSRFRCHADGRGGTRAASGGGSPDAWAAKLATAADRSGARLPLVLGRRPGERALVPKLRGNARHRGRRGGPDTRPHRGSA